MIAEKDHAVRELGRLRLTLRHDLVFSPQRSGGQTYYIIEDPVNSKFHRVGPAEYAFISLLDGRTPIGRVLELVASQSPELALSESEAASICKWLVESDLAHTSESSQPNQLLWRARRATQRQMLGWFNPIVLRLPLFHPDRFFARLLPWLGWMHCPAALVTWLIVVAAAAYQLMAHWDRFAASSRGILAPHNWLWLLVSWIALKLVHETAHGVVCKRYGGTVREAGVMLILLAPLAYVDVTTSWRFRSKWQRIQTAAAGMYVEIVVAAMATFLWLATDAGTVNNLCHSVMITASFMTLVVNANPLMRFDGYYILSDLVEVPNLYSCGQQYLVYWVRKIALGIAAARPSWTHRRTRLIATYGIAAFGWRILVCAGLVIAAAALFHGAGIVLACLAVVLWVGVPAAHFVRDLTRGGTGEPLNPWRLFFVVGASVAVVAFVLFAVPWPGASWAPAVVQYAPLTAVRAGSAGFVRELRVRTGDQVRQGDLLVVLVNDQLKMELAGLDAQRKQSQLNCRAFKQTHRMAAYQAEVRNLESLETKRREKAEQVRQLTIVAPVSGQILGRHLATMLGRYVKEGEEMMSIGNEVNKELCVAVSQDDHDVFRAQVGRAVTVRIDSGRRLRARFDHLDPRASLEPSAVALCAAAGGPLAVKAKPEAGAGRDERQKYELLAPRFSGTIALDPVESACVRAGQLGRVSIRAYHESMGAHLYTVVARWIRARAGR